MLKLVKNIVEMMEAKVRSLLKICFIMMLFPLFLIIKLAIYTVLIFIIFPQSSFGQQLNFRNYSLAEGLAQSQVYAMEEDLHGNIWFGTRGGGVSRFDGSTFVNFTVKDGLSSNFIRTILRDRKGNLWFGTDEGLSCYDGKKILNFTAAHGLYNTVVNCLMEDRKGILWIGTDKGIFQLDKDTIYRFGRKLSAPMTPVRCLYEDTKGNILAGTEFGLHIFDLNTSPWSSRVLTKRHGLPVNIITSVTEISPESFWICTYGGGISLFQNESFRNFTMKDGLGSNTVYTVTKGRESLWFGTSGGLTEMVKDSMGAPVFKTYTQTEGLPNNVVMSLLPDSFGNLWIGTSGGGVSKLDGKRFVHYTGIKGVFGAWVYSILQDKKGNMWFGTSEGGVTKYDGRLYTRYSQKHHFTASKVKAIHEDEEGNLWFGTVSDGAYVYDGESFRHYHKKNGLSSNFINFIVHDSSGNIWMATAGGGISVRLKGKNGKETMRTISVREGLSSERVNSLLVDKKNNIWAATLAGASYIVPVNDSTAPMITRYLPGKGKGDNQVRCLAMDPGGKVFMGTADAGVVYFESNRLLALDDSNKIPSKNIYSLLFDDLGQLWVGTEKGVDRVTFDGSGKVSTVRHYGKEEGFIGIETIQNSAFKDKVGNLWFGSLTAATRYQAQYDHPVPVPRILLTGIQLFFDPIHETEFGNNLRNWYPVPQNLVLPYDKNHLSFQFTGIEQRNPAAVRYKWKLEGFDRDWSPSSSRKEAVYSNLPPGEYVFQVTASNETGVWNETPQTFAFIIHPPFWRTWWFRAFTLSLLVVLMWLLVSWRYKSARRENRMERERLAMERNLLELEQKALRLQMNPHFLFNCLNSIKGLISEHKPEEAKVYLSRFSKMMRTMLENSRETFIPLNSEIETLHSYLELEKLSMGEKLSYSIEVEGCMNRNKILIPPMLLQPFVENSIVHGLQAHSGQGMIRINMEQEGQVLVCRIEDNGIGREASGQLRGKHEHKSSAIAITQERLNIINKKLNLGELKISIEDVTATDGTVKGTRVILKIPYIEE